jgi:hypothetical protein
MSVALENAGAAWVHSRDKVSGDTLVSTQKLVVVSEILDDYRTYAAMKASADSYGGINSNRVYLNPKSEESLALNTASGSGSEQQSGGSGSQTGGSEQSQGGSQSGDTTGGGDGQSGGDNTTGGGDNTGGGDGQSGGDPETPGGDGGEGLDKD